MKHEKARRQVLGMAEDFSHSLLLGGNSGSGSGEKTNANGASVRPGMRRRVTGGTAELRALEAFRIMLRLHHRARHQTGVCCRL